MPTSKVRLNICGSSYVIATTESEDYMQNLADRLNLDMNELMSSSNTVSITTAAVMTALSYRDELEKASGSADNMRRQIKNYLEDAASAKMAAEELRRENDVLRKQVDDLRRRRGPIIQFLQRGRPAPSAHCLRRRSPDSGSPGAGPLWPGPASPAHPPVPARSRRAGWPAAPRPACPR